MAHLIDKDAVVAEIERLKNTSLEYGYNTMQKILADSGKDLALEQLRYFLSTLKVKDVDINKEISQFIDANFEKATIGYKISLRRVAKHFFELGLSVSNKSQKEE